MYVPRQTYAGPNGEPMGGGAYQNYNAPQAGWPSDNYGRSDGRGPAPRGAGGGGGYGQVVTPGNASHKPEPPPDPMQKMRDVVKQLRQVINEQKARVNELRRDARKALNAGDKDSYDLYVDNMVHVRMFIRKINRAITNVNLAGTNMKMNQCNQQMCGALADFLKLQGEGEKIDMEDVTRNYFDQQMNLDNGLESFLENMKDLNDPDGVMEDERARERAKIEAEFGRSALSNAPDRVVDMPLSEVQIAREKLMS